MISIIIPCYNHASVLPKAVRSALSQRADKEVIVVDDGSDDPIRNGWGDSVRLLRHDSNKGLSKALNTGVKHSNGDKFVILAADDEMHPSMLHNLERYQADIVSCDMQVGGRHIKGRAGNLTTLKTANCHSYCAIVSKALWQRVGGYNEFMNPSWEDYEFFLHAAKVGANWHHVPAPYHIYNRNPVGRDAEAQGQDHLLRGKLEGFHQDVFGKGRGVVSFVIPCYKQEQYLRQAIESCLNQVYPHVNVMIVDDGSPGNKALQVVKDIDSPKVRLIRQRNKHLSGARNTGIREALKFHNSQYVVPLDADDAIHPRFVEDTMAALENDNQYTYTDVKFIGEANHEYKLPEYDCKLLAVKHLHPCTILMPSVLWSTMVNGRGMGYDETMKQGFEDWEFAIAAVESGYCGKRVAKPYFYYRFHSGGSMRTSANKISKKLVGTIRQKHPWMASKERLAMGCRTCGGSKYVKRTLINSPNGGSIMMVSVPSIGQMDSREPVQVTYTGGRPDTQTKIGAGGSIYKYSGNPNGTHKPTFTAYARDIHLFNGPYTFARMAPVQQEIPKVVVKPNAPAPVMRELKPATVITEEQMFQPDEERLAKKLEQKQQEVAVFEPDDFTELKGVGAAGAKKLVDAGFSYFYDVAEASAEELASILSISKSKAEKVQKEAAELESEIAVEE